MTNAAQVMDIQGKNPCNRVFAALQCGAMTRTFARLGGLGLVALAAALPLRAAQAADVQGARVWAGPEYTRVVFDLSGPVDYKLRRDGATVELDLDGGDLARGFGAPAAQGLYKGMESQASGSGLRLLAHAAEGVQPRSFLLKPAGGHGYRLVLDLY